MNDPDQTVMWRPRTGDDLSARLAMYDDAEVADRPVSEFAPGLVGLGFIGAALRRRMRLWLTLAVIGLLVGAGYYVVKAPTQIATVSVLLVDQPGQNPASEVQTDLALARSLPVAEAVIKQAGLQTTPTAFTKQYTAAATTPQIVTISVKAPTTGKAEKLASALATQFLAFRAQYEENQQQVTNAQLSDQVSKAQHKLDSLNKQVATAKQSGSSNLSSLQAAQQAASTALAQTRQLATAQEASTETVTQDLVHGSKVLDAPVSVKSSAAKGALLYGIGGMFGGLALGVAWIVIAAIISDKLRRRDDIAYAIGAPVRLSIGRLRRGRLGLERRGQSAVRQRDLERFAEYLGRAVPGSSKGPASLAVVAVNDAPTVARAVVEMAVSNAGQGKRIVLADLAEGAPAAGLLGVSRPGIENVNSAGTHVMVVVPEAADVAPVGPFPGRGFTQANEKLVAACARADLVLSLVTLDPAVGGEYLATWATEVVAVVATGRSNAIQIQAAGDMIRLSQARLGSVVVVDADKGDESLGALNVTRQPAVF